MHRAALTAICQMVTAQPCGRVGYCAYCSVGSGSYNSGTVRSMLYAVCRRRVDIVCTCCVALYIQWGDAGRSGGEHGENGYDFGTSSRQLELLPAHAAATRRPRSRQSYTVHGVHMYLHVHHVVSQDAPPPVAVQTAQDRRRHRHGGHRSAVVGQPRRRWRRPTHGSHKTGKLAAVQATL